MLPRYNYQLTGEAKPIIKKYIDGKDASRFGAFEAGKKLTLKVIVPRKLGDGGVVLRLERDGEEPTDRALEFVGSERGVDVYSIELKLGKGLYYWELLFLRGMDTLFTDSINNRDFELIPYSARKFRLSIYEEGSGAPDWFRGSIMYQIFPDRFAKGSKKIKCRDDAELENDWYEGMPEYAKIPGGKIKNNRFFGGTLWGIIEKLDYLETLGVGVIYLNPIFEAYSNHKYDTGNYEKVDAMFGGDAALKKLLEEADRRGIKVILDGVFNHTGSDSIYFNRGNRYETVGAYNSKDSEYYGWYDFREYPDDYECWWDIDILPRLNHRNESCRSYFTGEKGIGRKYIKMGIGGWRLDVADELSNEFLDEFSGGIRKIREDSVIIGEVWENAADKIAYGKRRRYFLDGQLDSVMNYPFRRAVIDFCTDGDAVGLYDTLVELYASYPKKVSDSLMNLLGTHDTERILTTLALGKEKTEMLTNDEKAATRLTKEEYERGKKLLKIASVLQYTVYGVPSLYYGDEAGMEGFGDPFCRMPYPWGREDIELLEHYRALGNMRRSEKLFSDGAFDVKLISGRALMITRESEGGRGKKSKITVIASRDENEVSVKLDGKYKDLISGEIYTNEITVPSDTAAVLKRL